MLINVGWKHYFIHKFQRFHRWNLWMDKQFLFALYSGCNYLFNIGLMLIHVSKRSPADNTCTTILKQNRTEPCAYHVGHTPHLHTVIIPWSTIVYNNVCHDSSQALKIAAILQSLRSSNLSPSYFKFHLRWLDTPPENMAHTTEVR